MKNWLNRLGFRRMDEMERQIAFRAQRNAYVFLLAALLVWTLYESGLVFARGTTLNPVPCMLLTAACAIQTISQLAMARSAVQDDEDSRETAPLLRLILAVCVVAGVVLTLGAAMVMLGMRTC